MIASTIVLGLYGIVRTLLDKAQNKSKLGIQNAAGKTAATTAWLALILIGVMGPIDHAELRKWKFISTATTANTTQGVAGGNVLTPDDIENLTKLDDEAREVTDNYSCTGSKYERPSTRYAGR
jgi:hypothetical protein